MNAALPGLSDAIRGLESLADRAAAADGVLRFTPGIDTVLTLDAPGSRGAMTVRMMVQLAGAVDQLRSQPPRTVSLRSAHPAMFCSGGHLGQVRASLVDGDGGLIMARCMTTVLDALWQGPWLTVAEVDGPALGGGAELLTACDAVFVGDQARIGFVHGRLGVVPGWGGTARLVSAVGRRSALALLATAAVSGPEQAVQSGLATGRLAEHAAWMEAVRAVPAEAVHAGKQQVRSAAPFVRRDDREARLFATVWGGATHRSRLGMSADS